MESRTSQKKRNRLAKSTDLSTRLFEVGSNTFNVCHLKSLLLQDSKSMSSTFTGFHRSQSYSSLYLEKTSMPLPSCYKQSSLAHHLTTLRVNSTFAKLAKTSGNTLPICTQMRLVTAHKTHNSMVKTLLQIKQSSLTCKEVPSKVAT